MKSMFKNTMILLIVNNSGGCQIAPGKQHRNEEDAVEMSFESICF